MSTIDVIRLELARTPAVPSRTTQSVLSGIVDAISRFDERRRSRRALLSMTDDQLKDIGLSRADAEGEGLLYPWE